MASRLILHQKLKELISNVYFQPPSAHEMIYPCIRYVLSEEEVLHADNTNYRITERYQITIIDEDPDSEILKGIRALLLCQFDRFYSSDDLNHWVFNLYF